MAGFLPAYVVIHTVGATDEEGRAIYSDPSADSIRDYHRKVKGWKDIGYHWVVRVDGTVEPGRPESEMGAHVEGFNSKSIGVVFGGHGDLKDFTEAQKRAGVRKVVEILRRHGLVEAFVRNPMRVLGHRETAQLVPAVFPGPKTHKTCPGTKVDCSAFRRLVLKELGH